MCTLMCVYFEVVMLRPSFCGLTRVRHTVYIFLSNNYSFLSGFANRGVSSHHAK